MRTLALTWLAGLALAAPAALRACEAPPPPEAREAGLVVHEWGVQVRSRVVVTNPLGPHAQGGQGQEAKPQELLAPPQALLSGLPEFVLRHEREFAPQHEARAWLKPVLHFYGPEGLEVSVKVLTPRGKPLAYWPRPELATETFWFMGSGVTDAVGMTWKGRLSAQPAGKAAAVAADHWWRLARAVPGLWFNAGADSERFVFYEASAVQEPLLTGKVGAEELTLANADAADSGPVMVIVNDGAQRHFLAVRNVAGKASVKISRKELLAAPGDEASLLAACRAQWESLDMTGEEARAIVEIWKPDLLSRTGFIVAARVPAEVYDQMFPLEVTPRPEKLVRAGVVFDELPGQDARLGWLPALERTFERWAADLADENYGKRRAAALRLAGAGDLARPFLEKLGKSADPEVQASARALLDQLQPGELSLPSHGKGSRPVNARR